MKGNFGGFGLRLELEWQFLLMLSHADFFFETMVARKVGRLRFYELLVHLYFSPIVSNFKYYIFT